MTYNNDVYPNVMVHAIPRNKFYWSYFNAKPIYFDLT